LNIEGVSRVAIKQL